MATYYEYKCKGCGYTAYANPKGKDMVMMGELYSYHCEGCYSKLSGSIKAILCKQPL